MEITEIIESPITALLLVLGILIMSFLIFRALVLWYWKIEHRVQHLESIDKTLKSILTELKKEKSLH